MKKGSSLDSVPESFFTNENEVVLYENIFDKLIVFWSKERTVAILQLCPNTVVLGERVATQTGATTSIRPITEAERNEINTLVKRRH